MKRDVLYARFAHVNIVDSDSLDDHVLSGIKLIDGCPLGGRWAALAVLELDEKGRALLPASLRKKLGARRFEVRLVKGRIELVPIQGLKSLKDKYRGRIKVSWARLEEQSENFVRSDKR